MECERLKRLIKNWYMQVQDEAMAPARMVDFMRDHVDGCATCLGDSIVELEIKRITEIVLPPSKIPKAVRKEEKKEEDETDTSVDDDETETNEEEDDDETETNEDEDGDETETNDDDDDDDLDPDDEDDDI